MSHTRGPPSGVVQTKRRTWDEDVYRKKAEERAQRENSEVTPAGDYLPASERAALTEREEHYDYQGRVGKVTAVNDKDRSSGGFYCELCDVLLRDSLSFTSHLNGRKHLRKAGISEYTKRSTLEEVLAVLEFGRRKRFPERYVEERLERAVRQGKMRSDRNGSEAKSTLPDTTGGKKEEEKEEKKPLDAEEAEMQAMLGFSSFGTGASAKSKNR